MSGDRALGSFAVYLEPRVLLLLFLGFASGLPLALTTATLFVWLREEGVSLEAVGLFAAVGTPYALKFLWAPLIDRVRLPLLGRLLGRRRGWLLVTEALVIGAILALGATAPAANPLPTAIWALALAFASASQDIVIDAYRIEILEERQLGAGAANMVFGYRLGLLVSGAGALYLATAFGWQAAYEVMAAAMLIGVGAVLIGPEPAGDGTLADAEEAARGREIRRRRPGLAPPAAKALAWLSVAVVRPFAEFLGRPSAFAILAFVALYKFGDSLAGVMTSPFLVDLGFSKVEIANVAKIYGAAATLAGLGLGGALINALGIHRALWIGGILQLASNFLFAVQAWAGANLTLLAVTIGAENLAGGLGTAAFVAYLSSLCNVSYTATQYALLSSFMAVARTWLSTSSGALAAWLGWFGFFLATAAAAVPGLILLWWLGRRFPRPAEATAPAR